MRKRAVFVLLLLSCFPDADKLRTKGGGGPGPITSGSGGGISIGGAGGNLGGAGGAGGAPAANRAQLCNELATASAAKAH